MTETPKKKYVVAIIRILNNWQYLGGDHADPPESSLVFSEADARTFDTWEEAAAFGKNSGHAYYRPTPKGDDPSTIFPCGDGIGK